MLPTIWRECMSKVPMPMPYVCGPVVLIGVLSLLAPAPVAGQSVASAVRIEGELDEAAWGRAEPITAFVQREPADGAPPTHRTEARVLYDDDAIYVAVKAFDDKPDQIKAFL